MNKQKGKPKEDFFFDDCAVCRFEKARQEGRLMPGTSELEGLKKAFREAKDRGATAWPRNDENNLDMKLFITAKPNAKEEKVEEIDLTHFRVSVKEPPVQGRANEAIIKALADFLNIAPSRLNIVSGHTSKQKVIEVSSPIAKTSLQT